MREGHQGLEVSTGSLVRNARRGFIKSAREACIKIGRAALAPNLHSLQEQYTLPVFLFSAWRRIQKHLARSCESIKRFLTLQELYTLSVFLFARSKNARQGLAKVPRTFSPGPGLVRNARAGFTLIELTIVIALISLAGGLLAPVGISFWRSQVVDETAGELISALRNAERAAFLGKEGQAHGVKVLEDSFVVFMGDAYVTRDQGADITIQHPASVLISGISEVVFSAFSGAPSVWGSIAVAIGDTQKEIQIYEHGLIE